MNYVISFLLALGITFIYFLLTSSVTEIAGVPLARLFAVFAGSFLGLLGLNLYRNTARKSTILQKEIPYYRGTRKIKHVRYIEQSTGKVLSDDYFDESGKLIKTIKYD